MLQDLKNKAFVLFFKVKITLVINGLMLKDLKNKTSEVVIPL